MRSETLCPALQQIPPCEGCGESCDDCECSPEKLARVYGARKGRKAMTPRKGQEKPF